MNENKSQASDIIHTLRTVHQNQTQLLILADQKANVLLALIGVLVIIMFTRLDVLAVADAHIAFPLSLFLAAQAVSFTLALAVITPKTYKEKEQGKMNSLPNPLFFGFFSYLNEEDFVRMLNDELADDESARQLLMRDLYQIGQVVKKKYQLLKYAYVSAAAGIIVPLGPTLYLLFFR